MKVFTVGHSNHLFPTFLSILKAHQISTIVDVRHYPGSRYNPQFNSRVLAESLHANQIGYVSLQSLGGYRPSRPDSVNTGWRNLSFRGFADYMQTPEFAAGMAALESYLVGRPALMCSEAMPWRCHRSMLADALLIRGHEVEHILNQGAANPHKLTEFACVQGLVITYPKAGGPGENRTPA